MDDNGFAAGAATAGPPIACTLGADGGDMAARLDEWRAVLAGATGREELDDGYALTFPHDIARMGGGTSGGGGIAELARLLAAEYACCSFATYRLTIDGGGVRVEVRTPPEARGALAAVFGTA